MPLYEYQCTACGDRFEKIVKFSDPPLETCPKCGSGPVDKLLSSPAIQFKGSGWYITDYAKKSSPEGSGSKPAAGKSADSASTSGSTSDSTASSSPAAASSSSKE